MKYRGDSTMFCFWNCAGYRKQSVIMRVTQSQVTKEIASILSMGLIELIGRCKNNPDLARAEVRHLHSLPNLLESFSISALKHYADVERSDYLQIIGSGRGGLYKKSWKIIDDFLKEH